MTIQKIYADLVNGKCFTNFNSMSSQYKLETVGKMVLAAVAAGILGSAVASMAAPIFMVIGGVAAFAYTTSHYTAGEWIKDKFKNLPETVIVTYGGPSNLEKTVLKFVETVVEWTQQIKEKLEDKVSALIHKNKIKQYQQTSKLIAKKYNS